ncbi:uncharacterized protein VTP21DRAFT_8168 [Calcarisporiella thermophila]|uniref:uncharacterized protein n=1 Tax=Calcarisporiella thermophila TaxID=911321 RepID=UPI003743F008
MMILALQTLCPLILFCTQVYSQVWEGSINYDGSTEYDYVVVGGGSAGGVLAVELAKRGQSVLLMEAGPMHVSNFTSTPLLFLRAVEDPKISFSFFPKIYAEETTQYQGETFYPRVGALGGCSIHNGMIAVYPKQEDFDKLVEVTGDESFKEPAMREYFKRMEKSYASFVDKKAHGFDGWFATSYLNPFNLGSSSVKTTKGSLFQKIRSIFSMTNLIGNPFYDINGYHRGKLATDVEAKCFTPMNVDPKTGQRGDYVGYILDTAKRYSNFHIWTNTLATRILIDKDQVARGVEYRKGAYLYKASPLSSPQNRAKAIRGIVKARREVIISAGVYNSPQLLMLSGIGDKQHLESMGITPIVDLKGVGQNLQDHHELSYVYKPKTPLLDAGNCTLQASMDDACYRDYSKKHQGVYSINGIVSAWMRKSDPSLPTPDFLVYSTFGNFFKFYQGMTDDIGGDFNAISRVSLKAFPTFNGIVKLKTSDPYDVPYINFRYFEENGEKEIDDLVKQIKLLRKSISNKVFEEVRPGSDVETDEALQDYVRKATFGHHACCTNKIGSDDDPLAVLDGRFRVRGVKQLRVVDGSSFPIVPGFFPAVFTHMIGLKAADTIIEDNKP